MVQRLSFLHNLRLSLRCPVYIGVAVVAGCRGLRARALVVLTLVEQLHNCVTFPSVSAIPARPLPSLLCIHGAAQICLDYCLDQDAGYTYFGTEYGVEVSLLTPQEFGISHSLENELKLYSFGGPSQCDSLKTSVCGIYAHHGRCNEALASKGKARSGFALWLCLVFFSTPRREDFESAAVTRPRASRSCASVPIYNRLVSPS